jgi:hypothetical protein
MVRSGQSAFPRICMHRLYGHVMRACSNVPGTLIIGCAVRYSNILTRLKTVLCVAARHNASLKLHGHGRLQQIQCCAYVDNLPSIDMNLTCLRPAQQHGLKSNSMKLCAADHTVRYRELHITNQVIQTNCTLCHTTEKFGQAMRQEKQPLAHPWLWLWTCGRHEGVAWAPCPSPPCASF